MKKFFATLVVLSFVAYGVFIAIAGACAWGWYQPEVPQKPIK